MEGTFIWDKSLPLVLLCLCLWGENGDSTGSATPESLFLEWHSSWSNHILQSHGILSQILLPTACFPPHGISPSLSYFILLTLVSRYFASAYPMH